MPAPTVTDPGDIVVINSNSTSGSQSVTVPAGAAICLLMAGYFHSTSGRDLTSASLNGASFAPVIASTSNAQQMATTWVVENPASGTFAWEWNGAIDEGAIIALVFIQDVDLVAGPVRASAGGAGTTGSFSSSTNDLCICIGSAYNAQPTVTGGGQSQVSLPSVYNSQGIGIATKAGVSGTTTMVASGTSIYTLGLSIVGTSTVLDQEGFAFGDDDGSESSHTLDTQDTDREAELGEVVTLRVIVNATGDPDTAAYTLRAQKNGSGGYTAVPVGASYKVPPVIETGDVTASGDNLTTPTSPWQISRPTLATGDFLALIIGWDDSTTNTGVTIANGPNSEVWQQIGSVVASYNTEVRMTAYYVVATGAWGAGSISVTPSANEQWTAAVIHIPAGEFDAANPIGASNTLASAAADETTVNCPALTCGSTDGSGRVIFAATADVDPQSALTSGWTSLSNVDRGQESLSVSIRDTAVANSESISAGDATTTIASDSWCSLIFVIRAPSVTSELYVATSSNVAGGGEATTARLAAPSGKTTGDFTTGRRWDDENGSDSVDIAEDFYTELEWVLTTQSPAEATDYWDFQVYAGETALDTYTETPRLTLVSGGGTETASVSPVQLSIAVTAVTATYVQAETAAAAPLAINLSVTGATAVYTQVGTAGVAPALVTLSVASVTAAYSQTGSAGAAPLAVNVTIAAVTATYTQAETAVSSPLAISVTAVAIAATYTQVEAAAVAPLAITATVTSLTAVYAQVNAASVVPLPITLSPAVVTAVGSQSGAASVFPLAVSVTIASVTATYTQVETAAVSPVIVAITPTSTTAVGVAEGTATVSPLQVVVSVVGVTAAYTQAETAAASPLPVTAAITETVATYTQVNAASVSPLSALFTIPAVTAVSSIVVTASAAPASLVLSLPGLTATYAQAETANVIPLVLALMIMSATAGTGIEFDFTNTSVVFGIGNSVEMKISNSVSFARARSVVIE